MYEVKCYVRNRCYITENVTCSLPVEQTTILKVVSEILYKAEYSQIVPFYMCILACQDYANLVTIWKVFLWVIIELNIIT